MIVLQDAREQETIVIEDNKSFKVLLTGKESNHKISSQLSAAGFEVDFIPLIHPLENASTNFSLKHLQPAIQHALNFEHAIVIAVEEEYQKIAIAVRKYKNGAFQLLNVHQLSSLLVNFWIQEYPHDNLFFLKSVHISELVERIAASGEVNYKNIIIEPGAIATEVKSFAEENEPVHIVGLTENQEFSDNTLQFTGIVEKIVKYEEQLREENKTLFDEINRLYQQFGFHKEKTFIVEFSKQSQRDHVQYMMKECRKNTAAIQERLSIAQIIDYNKGISKNMLTNKVLSLNFPSVDMLQIKLTDGTSITIVPQEGKVYFYVAMKGNLAGKEVYQEINKDFDERIFKLMEILNNL